VAAEELLHLTTTFPHGFSWPLLLCDKEEGEAATFGGNLAGTGIAGVFTRDEHTELYFDLVKGAVIWAWNILVAELHRHMLQHGEGWRILDLVAAFG
jgi:hypothetical protein